MIALEDDTKEKKKEREAELQSRKEGMKKSVKENKSVLKCSKDKGRKQPSLM